MKKEKYVAILQRELKRHYVYSYGPDDARADGKIVISKRFLSESDSDYLLALDSGDISIESCRGGMGLLRGVIDNVDLNALSLITLIQEKYEASGKMPERVEG